jgi:hypothetical protein
MFRDGTPPARLVQLELEAVCAALVIKDLHNPAIREALLTGLDEERVCWHRENLRSRLHGPATGIQAGGDGSIFLSGLTDDGSPARPHLRHRRPRHGLPGGRLSQGLSTTAAGSRAVRAVRRGVGG